MENLTKIAVVGAGSWGTALANLVAKNCSQVSLIARSKDMADAINETRHNPKYLKDLTLPENLMSSTDLADTLHAQLIILAVPTSAIRNTTNLLKEQGVQPDAVLVSVSKGIELGSGLRMSEVIHDVLPDNPVVVLSGPNHAEEVAQNLPTCTVIGCRDHELAVSLQPLFNSPTFRSYTSDDMIGIEWGGAIKNIFAIAAGIAEGLKLGDNAIAALVTRGLAEMTRLGMQFGAKECTFAGLSGVGDLMTTCYSPHSRNHQFGLALAKGLTVNEAERQLGMIAEGVRNTRSVYEQSKAKQVETPLIDAVYTIIYQGISPAQAIQALFTRELKAEG